MTDGEGGATRPGWDAGWRRSSSRNSFSMGDWKPPMRVAGWGAQGAGEVVAFEDEVAGAVDGAEEGDRFAVEEGGVADQGDGRAVGGVGATAQGRGDAGRAGLIACDLQGNRSWLMVGRLCSHEFDGGEDRVGG